MKTLVNYPFVAYACATAVSVCIMIIVDYVLGAEAEHLNAWVIVNRLLGIETSVGDSLAIRHFGLAGATALMIGINFLFGSALIQIINIINRIIHF